VFLIINNGRGARDYRIIRQATYAGDRLNREGMVLRNCRAQRKLDCTSCCYQLLLPGL